MKHIHTANVDGHFDHNGHTHFVSVAIRSHPLRLVINVRLCTPQEEQFLLVAHPTSSWLVLEIRALVSWLLLP